uniref:Uncharacterized protein n=1 Tax=Quercus lobata TaxID=97700 RepID=A0A7N2N0S5_QUELO
MKNENLWLKEIQGKGDWSIRSPDDKGNGQNTSVSDNYGIPYGISSLKSSYNASGIFLQDLTMPKDTWGDESKRKTDIINFLKNRSKSSEIIARHSDTNEVLDQRREVALSQSLFSAVLSLLVGMIVWEAGDPCMPLVVALFTVVGMSLKSVVQFFFTIKNKPASDAAALLSFNLFILGMLTYPALPRVATLLAPLALRKPYRCLLNKCLRASASAEGVELDDTCSYIKCMEEYSQPSLPHPIQFGLPRPPFPLMAFCLTFLPA